MGCVAHSHLCWCRCPRARVSTPSGAAHARRRGAFRAPCAAPRSVPVRVPLLMVRFRPGRAARTPTPSPVQRGVQEAQPITPRAIGRRPFGSAATLHPRQRTTREREVADGRATSSRTRESARDFRAGHMRAAWLRPSGGDRVRVAARKRAPARRSRDSARPWGLHRAREARGARCPLGAASGSAVHAGLSCVHPSSDCRAALFDSRDAPRVLSAVAYHSLELGESPNSRLFIANSRTSSASTPIRRTPSRTCGSAPRRMRFRTVRSHNDSSRATSETARTKGPAEGGGCMTIPAISVRVS